MRTLRTRISLIVIGVMFVFASFISLVSPVQAKPDCDYAYLNANGAAFYDPCPPTCGGSYAIETAPEEEESTTEDEAATETDGATDEDSTPPVTGVAGENKDYLGHEILTKEQLDAVKENMPIYKEAAKTANIPWQMIAAIHYRETRFRRDNPANGQGIFQEYAAAGTNKYPVGHADDAQFLAQTTWAASFLKEKATTPSLVEKKDKGQIKDAFFGYNGRASVYKTQATTLGFTEAYEGSPYVMNKADAKRDPASNSAWGQIKSDGGGIRYPANNDYGAYVVYASLAGLAGEDCTGISGDLNERIVKLAERELALWEAGDMTKGFRLDNPNSFSKYTYNVSGNWCAWFVSWILKEAGHPVNSSATPYWSYVSQFRFQSSDIGFTTHEGGGYVPKPGDLAIYKGQEHINIVVGYDASGKMLTIGGNQGGIPWTISKVTRNIGYGSSATSYVEVK